MLERAASAGHISPIISHLLPQGITHLQYVDDMTIMVELNDACVAHLKFILLCFEALSGLEINFSKSEVIVTSVSDDGALMVSRLLNYSLGSFPFKYLGLPISPFHLCAEEYEHLVTKVGNRVMAWHGKYNTSAGKVFLINACLSSLPMLTMGFYRLSHGTHDGFDKHRGPFSKMLLITSASIGL